MNMGTSVFPSVKLRRLNGCFLLSGYLTALYSYTYKIINLSTSIGGGLDWSKICQMSSKVCIVHGVLSAQNCVVHKCRIVGNENYPTNVLFALTKG